jgi:stress up-regulated protein Nod 19
MEAGLEYADGTNANINEGMWLHHLVLFNMGPGREDATCKQTNVSLPHVTVGSTSRDAERFFAAGNERTVANFTGWGVEDAGYKIRSTDKFAALIELMNETTEDKVVYLTITYDVVDGHPFKDDIKTVWFDVRNCGPSDIEPPEGKNQFSLSYNWTANMDGEVIGSIGHLHDGGLDTTLSIDGVKTCKNVAEYGTKTEYIQKSAKGHHSAGSLAHISNLQACYGNQIPHKDMKKGQNWVLTANYDFDQRTGMKREDGAWDEVMGIAIMYVRSKGS